MDMESVVLEHGFDAALLEQIDTLRMIRLSLAENMLKQLNDTNMELVERGLVAGRGVDSAELRSELQKRIATLRERLATPQRIFEDELELCIDLLNADEELDEASLD